LKHPACPPKKIADVLSRFDMPTIVDESEL
jgi:hypothetical protein